MFKIIKSIKPYTFVKIGFGMSISAINIYNADKCKLLSDEMIKHLLIEKMKTDEDLVEYVDNYDKEIKNVLIYPLCIVKGALYGAFLPITLTYTVVSGFTNRIENHLIPFNGVIRTNY
jgi:hypothetical protein